MNMITQGKVSFADFLKLCIIISLAAGVVFGIMLLVLGLLGSASAVISTDSSEITGLPGILISNMAVLVLCLAMGLLTGLIAYFPFVKLQSFLQNQNQQTLGG